MRPPRVDTTAVSPAASDNKTTIRQNSVLTQTSPSPQFIDFLMEHTITYHLANSEISPKLKATLWISAFQSTMTMVYSCGDHMRFDLSLLDPFHTFPSQICNSHFHTTFF
uniref:Ovule protein n=1 Tax=Mesocestoides corti TaxID=53468 RepID=A0A5K3FS85_MESCO